MKATVFTCHIQTSLVIADEQSFAAISWGKMEGLQKKT